MRLINANSVPVRYTCTCAGSASGEKQQNKRKGQVFPCRVWSSLQYVLCNKLKDKTIDPTRGTFTCFKQKPSPEHEHYRPKFVTLTKICTLRGNRPFLHISSVHVDAWLTCKTHNTGKIAGTSIKTQWAQNIGCFTGNWNRDSDRF